MADVRFDPKAALAQVEAIVATGIFCPAETNGVLFKAAFAWMIIHLHELTKYLRIQRNVILENVIHPNSRQQVDAERWLSSLRASCVHPASEEKEVKYEYGTAYGGWTIATGPVNFIFAGTKLVVREGDMLVQIGKYDAYIHDQVLPLYRMIEGHFSTENGQLR